MRQKTIFTTKDGYHVGQEVLLVGRYDEATGKESFVIYGGRYAASGYPGNLDKDALRFHGWRGTSNGVSVTAYGVRRIESITDSGKSDEWGES